jgi:D-alanyl-D-alanine dipeptidase
MSAERENTEEYIYNRLLQPIANMDELRIRKKGYRDIPIDTQDDRYSEPLVSLKEYGVPGQSYYSRPNALFSEGLPGVPEDVQVRKSIAEDLARKNQQLQNPIFTTFFGGEVELYVQEGIRIYSVQKHLYDVVFPKRIRDAHPDWSEQQVIQERNNFIASPTLNLQSPAPHASSAIDVWIRYKQPVLSYVGEDTFIPFGYEDAEISERSFPDYYENNPPTTREEVKFQHNRRAFNAIMTGEAFGEEVGFTPNPTEWWHFDKGNQLWSVTTGQRPYYGLPPEQHLN